MRRLIPYAAIAFVWPATLHAQDVSPPTIEVAPQAEPAPRAVDAPTAPDPEPAEAPTDSAMESGPEAEPEVSTPVADAAATEGAAGWGDWAADAAAESEDTTPVFESRLYGFIDSYFEQVAKTPVRDPLNPGRTTYESNPYEFDVLNFNAMVLGTIMGRYRFFINLASPGSGSAGDDAPLGVRNAWVEAPIVPGYLNVRAGKTYRRFGLYNEILDAVPTFIGIEPPEMFDKDHLLLTRTTNLMLFGSVEAGPAMIHYSLATGNDERTNDAVPLGADVYAEWSWLRIGTSFYTSGGDAAPTRGVGDGSPRGGVINWMEKDSFYVFGGYAQIMHDSGLIAQVEYWQANHDGVRDTGAISQLGSDADLHGAQLDRFFVGGDPTGTVRTKANYSVRTAYLRLGYEVAVGDTGSVTPYVQADYYDNPETIAQKSFGGDGEAGIADDGKFQKYTAGIVLRPVSQVALKVDGSAHVQRFNGRTEFYPELRLSLSYLWSL